MCLGQQPSGAIQRIVLAAPMPDRLVLDAAATLVQLLIRELDEMERVGDLGDVRERVVEGLAIRPGEVQHAPTDRGAPLVGTILEPGAGTAASRPSTTSRSCAPPPAVTSTIEVHHCWVRQRPRRQNRVSSRPSAADRADPFGILDQRCPIGDHRVVDGVPVAAELAGNLRHRATEPTDLLAHHRPARSVIAARAGASRGSSPVHDPSRHDDVRAAPPMLVPHQPRWPTEARQVHQLDLRVGPSPTRSRRTARPSPWPTLLDMHHQRRVVGVIDAEHVHLGKTNQQLAHTRRVTLHRDSPDRMASRTSRFSESLCRARWTLLHPHTPLRSEAPVNVPGAELAAPIGMQNAAGDVTASATAISIAAVTRRAFIRSSIAQPTMLFENTSLSAHT